MKCPGGCSRRCRAAAKRAGWVLHDDGWWRHPTNGEHPFRDEDVTVNPTKVMMQRPSIRKESIGVIKQEALERFEGFFKRIGLT